MWLRNIRENKSKIEAFIPSFFIKNKLNESRTQTARVMPMLKNVEGKEIMHKETIDDHFKQLSQMWK